MAPIYISAWAHVSKVTLMEIGKQVQHGHEHSDMYYNLVGGCIIKYRGNYPILETG